MASLDTGRQRSAMAETNGGKANDHRSRQDIINSRQPLRGEIEELIKPYRGEHGKAPPFGTGQLIVMSIICSDEEWISTSSIRAWVLDTFGHLRGQAVEKYKLIMETVDYDRSGEQFIQMPQNVDVLGDFYEELWNYRMPLQKSYEDLAAGTRVSWTTTQHQAREFLGLQITFERKGYFHILDLPAELRNRIYEAALVYPCSVLTFGTSIPCSGCGARCHICEEHGGAVDYDDCRRKGSPLVGVDAQSQILNLLRTNKQIYREAMPIYYGLNKFYYGHNIFAFELLMFSRSMEKLSTDRIGHIKDLIIDLGGYMFDSFRGLKTAASNMSLDSFEVIIDGEWWIKSGCEGIPGMEGIKILARNAKTFKVGFTPSMRDRLRGKSKRVYKHSILHKIQEAKEVAGRNETGEDGDAGESKIENVSS